MKQDNGCKMRNKKNIWLLLLALKTPEIHWRVNTKLTVHAAVPSIDPRESLGILKTIFILMNVQQKITNFLSASEPSSQKELLLWS